mmetsp:Transcript_13863/g.20291  ORF Transcript_13863/g.20291 Transcript_13863/m.20291 type:complete len:215 (+) Transcript_13863:1712-2356(+)
MLLCNTHSQSCFTLRYSQACSSNCGYDHAIAAGGWSGCCWLWKASCRPPKGRQCRQQGAGFGTNIHSRIASYRHCTCALWVCNGGKILGIETLPYIRKLLLQIGQIWVSRPSSRQPAHNHIFVLLSDGKRTASPEHHQYYTRKHDSKGLAVLIAMAHRQETKVAGVGQEHRNFLLLMCCACFYIQRVCPQQTGSTTDLTLTQSSLCERTKQTFT